MALDDSSLLGRCRPVDHRRFRRQIYNDPRRVGAHLFSMLDRLTARG